MSAPSVFVAGAHTEIGKTHVACALIRAARGRGLRVEGLKPVVSGFDPEAWADSDPGRLLAALGVEATPQALQAMAPWRFAAPLAPPMAARLEQRALPLDAVADFCAARIAASRADLLVVEGVGGVMSPITEGATCLDLILALATPTLLVGGSYLGAISHTLTALETLRARAATPLAVVVSQSGEADAPAFAETVALIADHAAGAPVIAAGRDGAVWGEAVLDALLAVAP